MNNSTLDSSFLAAFYNPVDPYYRRAANFIKLDRSPRLVPEVAFLMNRAGGIPAVASFLNALIVMQPNLQTLIWEDLTRTRNFTDVLSC